MNLPEPVAAYLAAETAKDADAMQFARSSRRFEQRRHNDRARPVKRQLSRQPGRGRANLYAFRR